MGKGKHIGIHVGLGMGAAAMYSIINRPPNTSQWVYTILAGAVIGGAYSAASVANVN